MTATLAQDNAHVNPQRYHPALVTLHWVIVVLVLINLLIGLFVFAPALSAGGPGIFRIPQSLVAIHIAVGLSILVLLAVRFIIRLTTRKPAPATAGNPTLNVVARLVHYALYVVLFALTIVGLIFAVRTNRLQRAFIGGGPRAGNQGFAGGNFGGFPPQGFGNGGNNFQGFGNGSGGNQGFQGNGFQGNGFRGGARRAGVAAAMALLPIHLDLAILLGVLLIIHVLAALYHQFLLKDHLISRMWYGKRGAGAVQEQPTLSPSA